MRAPCEAISSTQALEVAAMARRIAEQFGAPQDVEWAFEDGVLHVLQARPITALPDPVEWKPPHPEVMYSRNFRLGEWLPEPVTPLFATLVLPALEASMAVEMDRWWGVRIEPPTHAVVNGWYFHAPLGRSSLLSMFRGFFVHPVELFGIMSGSVRLGIEPEEKRWREDRRPRYVAVVARGETEVDRLEPSQLLALVAELSGLAGEIQWSLQTVGGFAWKIEGELAKFYGAHLRPTLGGSHQPLLRGLRAPTAPPDHMVVSLDPVTPTVGELRLPWSPPPHERLVAMDRERTDLEARCKDALTGRKRERFEQTLAIAQKYALVREEQIADLSLGWPLMRRALRRLGEHLVGARVLARPDDVYFLRRAEIELGLAGQAPHVDVSARQRARARQTRLAPPLTIGTPMKLIAQVHGKAIEAMRSGSSTGNHLVGMPASPGRAKGPVRVVRGPAEFDRLQPGEVLVAPTTSPAWTPLFARAVAIVTDGGSVAAHASLVAREYGLPAVVAAEGATSKLRDGMIVTVDGSAGVVELEDS